MVMPLFCLSGKKAIVIGGSTGIGKASAIALATAGADVAIAARNEKMGEYAIESIASLSPNSFFVHCDVEDEDSVRAAIKTVADRFGRLDIAVNSFGLAIADNDLTQTKPNWDRLIAVNLTGAWLCLQAQVQQMASQNPMGGKIINISSVAARSISIKAGAGYCTTKAAVVQLTRSFAAQFGRYNINVNSICPGVVMTQMTAHMPPEYLARLREIIPVGHIARPEDIYGSVLFLASDASNYVTGVDLVLDGGRTLSTWVEPLDPRGCPPRVSPEEEIFEMNKELAMIQKYREQE